MPEQAVTFCCTAQACALVRSSACVASRTFSQAQAVMLSLSKQVVCVVFSRLYKDLARARYHPLISRLKGCPLDVRLVRTGIRTNEEPFTCAPFLRCTKAKRAARGQTPILPEATRDESKMNVTQSAAGRSRNVDSARAFFPVPANHDLTSEPTASVPRWKFALNLRIWTVEGPKGSAARNVLAVLLWNSDGEGRTWLGIPAITKKAGLGNERTARKALERLTTGGWIKQPP